VEVKGFPAGPGGTGEAKKDIEFSGRVMSCRTTPTRKTRIGMEFVDIKSDYVELIKKYVAGG
jgi:hypothetical protein